MIIIAVLIVVVTSSAVIPQIEVVLLWHNPILILAAFLISSDSSYWHGQFLAQIPCRHALVILRIGIHFNPAMSC